MKKLFLCLMLVTLTMLSACKQTPKEDEQELGPAKLEDFSYIHERDFQPLATFRNQISFEQVTPEMFANAFSENGISGHPRLITNEAEINRVRGLIGSNETIDQFYQSVKNRADSILRKTRPVWGLDSVGARVQSVHEYSPGLVDAAFYYLLNPNQNDPTVQAYKTKAIDYVIALTEYKDWGSGPDAGGGTGRHFLDTGVAASNVGIFYDLMYNEMTQEQRTKIKNGLIRLAINPGYDGVMNNAWWSTIENNWNAICNGGLIIASMALYGEEDNTLEENTRYEKLIAKAFNNMDIHIKSYFPSGGSEEGYMYWEYALMYLELPLEAFNQNLGTTFGRTENENFKKIAYSPMTESGPATGIAVGDDPVKTSRSSSRIWFSYFYNLADIQSYRLETVREDKLTWREVMYYKPELDTGEKVTINAPLDIYIRGLEEVSLRSSYDTQALFGGLHVGPNNASHGHLDAGQFDLQSNGLNWIYGSFGRDDYQIPGYFSNGGQPGYEEPISGEQLQAKRNHIYRIRTESKSAVVIKPGGSKRDIRQEQADNGLPVVEKILSKPKGAFTIVNLTDPYRRDIESYKRGMMISQDRQVITLQDEIINKSEDSWVYWSVNLNAGTSITVNPDGKSAILELAGQYMYVQIASPIEGSFMIFDANYYPNESNFPLTTGQALNPQKKLVIRLTDVKETTISVNFVPLKQWETEPSFKLPKVKPMSEWNIADGEIAEKVIDGPKLDSIKIDGTPISGFTKDKITYEHTVPLEQENLPVVVATAASGIKITTQVNEHYAFIFAEQDGKQTVYSIRLKVATSPTTADLLPIVGVTATDAQDGNPPENAVDGINEDGSRWSSEGVQSITLDLGQIYDVQFLSMALFSGNERSQLYNIYLSEDGINYTQMYQETIQSSGTTSGFETVKFALTKARYVKIACYGNTVSAWNSIKEINVYGKLND